uniref:CRAL-TRIO domain-containing protein n=1 Tax=Stomoxys calcitrans TaxID=35570 RepID=A0A1I8PKY0_STOCA
MNPATVDTPPVIRPLPAALQELAICELNEKPDQIVEYILTLRKWIHNQRHLKARTNDQFLLAFLRGSKYSLERAKQKLDRYYTLKAAIPEVFNAERIVDNPQVLEIIREGIILQIPLPENDTRPCVTIIRAASYDTNKYKFADIIRVGSMFGEMMMIDDDRSTVSGFLEIMDMAGVTGSHLFQLQPDLLRKFSVFADEAMPMRQKGTCFINVPSPFEKGFNTLKGFFPEKMKSRISVCSTHEIIYEHAPREYLPVEYGGTNGTMRDIVDRMEAKLMKYREYFEDEHNYGTDEQYRYVETAYIVDSDFGTDGSFRKLEFD